MTQLTTTQQAWANRRPVLDQLPEKGFQDSPVASWLTLYVDETLSGWADMLQSLWSQLDPTLAPDDWLDYLGYIHGLSSDPYWQVEWSPAVKRAILLIEHDLRKFKGTLTTIRKVLDIHQVPYSLYVDGQLLMPFTFPGLMGTGLMRFFVLVPQTLPRTSSKWREADRTLRGYCPAVTQSMVAYRGFTLNLSNLNEPMFSQSIYNIVATS